MLDYVDIGVTTLLIRGFDPLDDAIDYGRYLLPLVREEIARRDRAAVAASVGDLAGHDVTTSKRRYGETAELSRPTRLNVPAGSRTGIVPG